MAEPRPPSIRNPERGSILVVSLIALVALLGIGVVTMLAVRSDTSASGNDRFQQISLYAAESGVAAGIEFLRNNCSAVILYSEFVEPNNVNPQEPVGIVGNNMLPGQTGNQFDPNTRAWYRAVVKNNEQDPGYATGDDQDGIVRLEVTGFGPNDTRTMLRLDMQSPACIAQLCDADYAQRGVNARNDMLAVCGAPIDLASVRSFQP